MMRRHGALGVSLALAAVVACGTDDPPTETGRLDLRILEATTGKPTPARVELIDADARPVVPDDALLIFSDCGNVPVHSWIPAAAPIQTLLDRHREVPNPYSGTTQFYSNGSLVANLPPGRYAVAAEKGFEYETADAEIVIEVGKTTGAELRLVRWIDLPAEGWYSADDHLHIPRPHPGFDPVIATWMQAEDLHVANLLQMGLARDVHITPQHRFGPAAVYRQGDTLVVTGQENPRTHVLGHSIILGAAHWIDDPSAYLLYDRFWGMAREQEAVNGYAHWALGGAQEGLAVWGHRNLLDFIEVLNLGLPFYQRWYETLDLGLRIAPTAGTDYPCLPGLPGRERFYARLDGPLDHHAWLEAVRRGRTFVTNGPVLELRVAGAGVGDEVRVPRPGRVSVEGRVSFDPNRDEVTRLELIRGGEVALAAGDPSARGELRLEGTIEVEQSTWLALRASGAKRGETPIDLATLMRSLLTLERRGDAELIAELPAGSVARPSAAHSAAVFVTVDGTPPIYEQERARQVEQAWLGRLDELAGRLRDDRIEELAGFPGRGDGIGETELLSLRQALLEAIDVARRAHARPAEP